MPLETRATTDLSKFVEQKMDFQNIIKNVLKDSITLTWMSKFGRARMIEAIQVVRMIFFAWLIVQIYFAFIGWTIA